MTAAKVAAERSKPPTARARAVGLAIVLVLVVAAVLAELVAPHDPMRTGAGPRLVGPSLAYPFGTDAFGRDILSRVIHGTRLTLQIGTIAVGISLTAGLLIGLLASYEGGWPERILMRSVDVIFSFTETLIALAVVAVLGPSLTNAMIAVGIAAIPSMPGSPMA